MSWSTFLEGAPPTGHAVQVYMELDELAAAPTTLEAAEREHIIRVLNETGWVLAGANGAAERLGMKRTTLQSRMKKLGIQRADISAEPADMSAS